MSPLRRPPNPLSRKALPSWRSAGRPERLALLGVAVLAVLQALRADQWLANHPDAAPAQRKAIKQAVRDAFYQDADDWKAMLHTQSLARAHEALDGLVASRA